MSTAAPVYSIAVPRGSKFERTFYLEDEDGVPISLAGYTARLQVRLDYEHEEAVLTLPDDYEHGELYVMDAPDAHRLALILYGSGLEEFDSGVWDIRLTSPDGLFERLVQGTIFVDPDATR